MEDAGATVAGDYQLPPRGVLVQVTSHTYMYRGAPMTKQAPKRVREQVVVYLDERDRALLERLTKTTGLAKTELFRRGLRRLADDALTGASAGYSLRQLVATAGNDDFPADVAERPDEYLYRGKYQRGKPRKRARTR